MKVPVTAWETKMARRVFSVKGTSGDEQYKYRRIICQAVSHHARILRMTVCLFVVPISIFARVPGLHACPMYYTTSPPFYHAYITLNHWLQIDQWNVLYWSSARWSWMPNASMFVSANNADVFNADVNTSSICDRSSSSPSTHTHTHTHTHTPDGRYRPRLMLSSCDAWYKPVRAVTHVDFISTAR